jgi:membrane protein DedA with SNARE-associated domain
MMFRKFALSTAAAALAFSPVAAQAATSARTTSPVAADQEQFAGRGIVWPILIALAVGLAIWLIIDDSDDIPASP